MTFSATRLYNFQKFLVTNFITKEAKISGKLFGLCEKHHF